MKKTISLLLALLMLAPTVLASCADSKTDETQGNTNTPSGETEIGDTAESSDNPYYDGYVDPFTDLKFDGRTFTVHNSINAATATMQSSSYLIEGPEDYVGDGASDKAFERNGYVENLLEVDLVFDDYDYGYGDVAANIRQLMSTGDTTYDLIINDIFGLAPIVTENLFAKVDDGAYFDFSNPWWYDNFMSDISLNTNVRFMLAGDFFIDLLRTAHALFMNKNVYIDNQLGDGDPNAVYQTVINGEWTLDKFNELISQCYHDTNGDGLKDEHDTFGFVAMPSWGPVLPFIIGGDPGFIERDAEGYPVIIVNNERSTQLVEKILAAYNNEANLVGVVEEQPTMDIFTEGRALFIGYQRLGTLENAQLRDSEAADLAVLPYPKLDELQKNYVTSAHDTSELGFIPVTVGGERLDFVSAVVEVLCRETYAKVLPTYYEESLKVRYTRDEASAQMIDIIHDNFGNGFPLAYSNALNGIFLKGTFGDTVTANDNSFASRMKSNQKVSNKLLGTLIDNFEKMLAENE